MQGFLIAGTNSGCGKTTISIGLMTLLKSLGKSVAPFKTGPDYIDPLFHGEVLGTFSYNLDSFMLSQNTVKHLFHKHSSNKDIAIVEGVMGMYDGLGGNANGSSYELAQILNLPVVLIVSCKGLYQSVAAIVKGFATLKTDSNVKGVILNHVPNDKYYEFLKSIIERDCDIPCLGYLPSDKEIALESRHLGLIQAEEVDHFSYKIKKLCDTLSNTIDVERLLEISNFKPVQSNTFSLPQWQLNDLDIGVAYDKAFRFYYRDNLELLEKLGAKLHYFSLLKSKELPPECNCLYIGGGYPEVFAKELSENTNLLRSINKAIQGGMPAYAECGGLMYLCKSIIDTDGKHNNMVGVFDTSVQMTKHLKRFGYANVIYDGVQSKCHEFHRSEIINNIGDSNYTLEYQLTKPEKKIEWQCGLKAYNCLAGYAHIHFYSNFQFLQQIIKLWRTAIT